MRKNRRQGESSKIQFGRKKTFLFQNFFIPTLENNYENVFYGNIFEKCYSTSNADFYEGRTSTYPRRSYESISVLWVLPEMFSWLYLTVILSYYLFKFSFIGNVENLKSSNLATRFNSRAKVFFRGWTQWHQSQESVNNNQQ